MVDEAPKEVVKDEKDEDSNSHKNEEVKPYIPPIPFLQRLKDRSKKNNFMKYMEMFKKILTNISFIGAISHMPHYEKFLEEIVSNKKRLVML